MGGKGKQKITTFISFNYLLKIVDMMVAPKKVCLKERRISLNFVLTHIKIKIVFFNLFLFLFIHDPIISPSFVFFSVEQMHKMTKKSTESIVVLNEIVFETSISCTLTAFGHDKLNTYDLG